MRKNSCEPICIVIEFIFLRHLLSHCLISRAALPRIARPRVIVEHRAVVIAIHPSEAEHREHIQQCQNQQNFESWYHAA